MPKRRLGKFKVAIVAEFESELDLTVLSGCVTICCPDLNGENKIQKVLIETFEIEELDYKKIDLTGV